MVHFQLRISSEAVMSLKCHFHFRDQKYIGRVLSVHLFLYYKRSLLFASYQYNDLHITLSQLCGSPVSVSTCETLSNTLFATLLVRKMHLDGIWLRTDHITVPTSLILRITVIGTILAYHKNTTFQFFTTLVFIGLMWHCIRFWQSKPFPNCDWTIMYDAAYE